MNYIFIVQIIYFIILLIGLKTAKTRKMMRRQRMLKSYVLIKRLIF